MNDPVMIGLDVGTGGVRAVAADAAGEVVAERRTPLPAVHSPFPGASEQDPETWWRAAVECSGCVARDVNGRRIAGVSVDSTSGTIVPVNAQNRPLRPALMYNDRRAEAEANDLNERGAALTERMGYRFNSSYGLAKILWLIRHEPEPAPARFVNAADFVAARLAGGAHTDYTNALKMGYDLVNDRWPPWLESAGISVDRLPRVLATGRVVGEIGRAASEETGLPAGTPVAIGATDGVAAFYASGASRPGEAVTTLGTTLVVKSVSEEILRDPLGRLYCHRHADGGWLPGGASNCGGGYLDVFFEGEDPARLTGEARRFLPCSVLLYPLPKRGERCPTVNPDAERFVTAEPSGQAEHFAAYLQGMAFVERWTYDVISELGGEANGAVFTSGGGSANDVWMQLRADVLGRETARTASPSSAFGSAVLAASHTLFKSVSEAAGAMAVKQAGFTPQTEAHRKYGILYQRFRAACSEKGIG